MGFIVCSTDVHNLIRQICIFVGKQNQAPRPINDPLPCCRVSKWSIRLHGQPLHNIRTLSALIPLSMEQKTDLAAYWVKEDLVSPS